MADDRDRSLAEMSVLLPLGVAGTIADALPGAARRARHELTLARFVGKLTVDQALRELRRRLEPEPSTTNGAAPARPTSTTADDQPEADESTIDASVVTVEELALPDYDQLPAAHIVAKLAGLTEDERSEIEAYERSHRARRTVLSRLAQLG